MIRHPHRRSNKKVKAKLDILTSKPEVGITKVVPVDERKKIYKMQPNNSASVVERIKGNKLFERSKSEGLSYVLRRGRLEDAIACYVRAERLASNLDEYASATKNHGKAAWLLYCLFKEKQEKQALILFYLKEATKFLCLSYEKGSSKQDEWREDILVYVIQCMEELDCICEGISDINKKCDVLFSFVGIVSVKSANAKLQLKLANILFHDAIKLLQVNNYKKALSRLKDCYRPIEEAKRINLTEFDVEIRVLRQDVYFHTCSAESIQAREAGHQLLDIATLDEECLNTNLVWDAIDWYKRAAILTRELDLEQEAIALSHLGFVYFQVIKLKYKSKEYYKMCLELVESMKPRTFFTQDWYQQCVSTLQKFQMEERLRDEREKQKEREKKLEALKEELEDLKKNDTGKYELLIHVYNNYSPKIPKWQKPSEEEMAKWKEMETKDLKKVLLKGISAYHPDKVDEAEHGEKWKLLCEEITKMLTTRYQELKDLW